MISIAQITTEQIPEVQTMIREYLAWTKSFGDESERAPTFEAVDEELENLPGIFVPPHGCLLVATVDDQVAGCVALKPHDDQTCELKRLYVRPIFRGHNLGRLLAQALIAEAKTAGCQKMVLDTHRSMTHAHAIYRELGFMDVPVPADFPEDLKDLAYFMELDLTREPAASAE